MGDYGARHTVFAPYALFSHQFDGGEREKQARLDTVVDELKERFGAGALRRGIPPGCDRPSAPEP